MKATNKMEQNTYSIVPFKYLFIMTSYFHCVNYGIQKHYQIKKPSQH